MVQVTLCMGHTRAATFAGFAGRCVAALWVCCAPWCGVRGWGVVVRGCSVLSAWPGGAVGLGVGWVRGMLQAGSGCRGLTVGGSSAVSPWCVPWWPLVGWLEGGSWGVPHPWGHHCVLACRSGLWGWDVCRCCPCGRRQCVVCRPPWLLLEVRCGRAWGVVLGLAVSWEGAGHAGSGRLRGGRACVCVRVFALCSLCGFFLTLSPALGGGGACGWAFLALGVGVGACRCRCWCGCGCREG